MEMQQKNYTWLYNGWQVTLCDPIWQVTLRGSEKGLSPPLTFNYPSKIKPAKNNKSTTPIEDIKINIIQKQNSLTPNAVY